MKQRLNYYRSIKFLSKYIKRYKHNFIMFYFGWLIETILSILMPILFGIMIDEIVYYQNINSFMKIGLVFAIISVFICFLYFLIYAQDHYLMSMYTFDIKRDLFKHFLMCDAQYLSGSSSGDIVTMVQNYSDECMHFIIRNVIHFFNGIICIIAVSSFLIMTNWKIGLFVLITAPISVFINKIYGKKILLLGVEQREHYGEYISWLFEMLSALKDIRLLGAQNKVCREFKEQQKDMFLLNIKTEVNSINAANVISFVNLIIQLLLFTLVGYLVKEGSITIGMLTTILAFHSYLIERFRSVSSSYLDSQNRISYIQAIYDFMESPIENNLEGKIDLNVTKGNIEIKNVYFKYNKNNVLFEHFNLSIKGGERLAIVGKSGCGKTTLAYMLARLYRPSCGSIIVDGQDISECNVYTIRQNIGLIAQDVLIYNGTIKENILLGNRMAEDSDIVFACKQAGLWEYIESLSDGLNTVIGSQGVQLSGGEKQRVAIARIYLKNPKIIIFDESTSALDEKTEAEIYQNLEKVLIGRTAIVISHRESAVMLCDRVAIIENRKVREVGKPDKMRKESQAFKSLFAIKED